MTAAIQAVIFFLSDSIALLADLIHNVGDALTAVPLGIAFALRSQRAENYAGLAVVLAIFVSACAAAHEAIVRLINPHAPTHLLALGLAGRGWVRHGASVQGNRGAPFLSARSSPPLCLGEVREGVPVTDLAAQLGHAVRQ